jgi:hypothetical protein
MTDDISQAVLNNSPLPLRDIGMLPAGLFREQMDLELASYLEESAALAHATGSGQPAFAGLLPADPSTHRYIVAVAKADEEIERDERYALPATRLEWNRGGSTHARSAAVVAAARDAGARDAFQTAIRHAVPPSSISGAADLDGSVALVTSISGTLKIAGGARLGFDYNWVREIAAGRFAGDLGLAVATGMEARLEASLDGSYTAAVTLEEGRRLRLRLFRNTASGMSAASKLAVKASVGEVPGGPAELAAALLGVHYAQWLEFVERASAAGTAQEIAARIGATPAALGRFFERWKQVEARAAEAIWSAAGGPALDKVVEWAHRAAAEMESAAVFRTALADALEADPDFGGSPAALWIEAAAGGLLAPAVDDASFRALSNAAAAANGLLGDAEALATLGKLKEYARRELDPAALQRALTGAASLQTLDEWLRRQLGADPAAKVRAAMAAAQSICEKAAKAVANKYSAELAYRLESTSSCTALIDCSFEFTPAGLELYRECLAGDFSRALRAGAQVTLRQALLTHCLHRQVAIELHLPLFSHTEWIEHSESLAKLEVEAGEDGRLFAYTVAASDRLEKKNAYQSVLALTGSVLAGARNSREFTLSFTDRRMLPRRQARAALGPVLAAYDFGPGPDNWLRALPGNAATIEASLTLSMPGSTGACWLQAPRERDQRFLPVYTAMSVAVQTAMRKWLPMAWFADPSRYNDLGAAFPLLVYQALPPFRGKRKSELAYDPMSLEGVRLRRPGVLRNLSALLEVARQAVEAEGKKRLAWFYAPSESERIITAVEKQPRQLLALLAADAAFIDGLVNLGVRGAALAELLERDPAMAVKQLAAFSAKLVAAFHRKLRRLYGGQGFVSFGSLLFMEATRALGVALSAEAKVAGVLRLSSAVDGQPPAAQTFVNSTFRP